MDELTIAARTLAVDAVTAEVVSAWRERGIDSILIKGPTTASWLYPDRVRGYNDSDLLVSPEALPEAGSVLSELGFQELDESHPWTSWQATGWLRERDGALVDLHRCLYGPQTSAEFQWAVLTAHWTEQLALNGTYVQVPVIPARALIVALHAEQHDDLAGKPLEDLRRALDGVADAQWETASLLADEIHALRRMVGGLELLPAGREVVSRLPLLRAQLLSKRDREMVMTAVRWRHARGLRAKARVLRLGPTALRESSRLARRGSAGLVAAAAWRVVVVVARSPRLLFVWRSSRS